MQDIEENIAAKNGQSNFIMDLQDQKKMRYQPEEGFLSCFHKIDIFGQAITFHVDKKNKTITTIFGGIMTIMFLVVVLS